MIYEIKFTALNTRGDTVGSGHFSITTPQPLDLTKCGSIERFCVEYARLTGIKCSFARTNFNQKG